MKIPNPIDPDRLTAAERRAELCGLLARGLLRLRARAATDAPDHGGAAQSSELSAGAGESSLHSPPDQCRHATPTHRRSA